ncbi:MAG TPA: glycoside hydrolase family 2 TIM barrel-domain containing protein, partial [Bacteroidales bacterium]|nr:glycoside hydrolase family 2 TIM barrel-domain containing protein [Bacteroidales bacterium]
LNVLAVEVFKQNPGDLGHGFVDWNPAPPDNNLGLWREVYVKITGETGLKNTFISSDVDTETLEDASLTLTTELINHSDRKIKGKLNGYGDGIRFGLPVELEAGETKKVTVTPQEDASLHISNPRLWWCHNMGEPNLYHITVNFENNGIISDSKEIEFGIREIEPYFNGQGHRGFKLNGKEILIRGAGWTDDVFLRDNEKTNEIQVQYVKHMNLNTIRFENVWGTSPNIYELCDKYGLLAMVGWSCQWEWENYLGKECDEFGGIKSPADMDLAVKYLEDQIRYLQNHPSIFVWMLGSDMIPRPALEKRYSDLIKSIDNRPYLAAASWRNSSVSGNTGVKMKGPYNYVGPSYWFIDSVNGGAYGFNTETGPGPQIPVMETIEKMIPKNKLWPINETWNFHCNPSESFGDLSIFNNVLYRRYGQPANLKNYLLKADVQAYEAMRGMFDAFRSNRPNTTGIIQWMLNSAWPSFYWQLYDYYFLPTAAYYAARKANSPVQVAYNYGNNKIYAVNETLVPVEKAIIGVKLSDYTGKVIYSDELIRDIPENRSTEIHELPAFHGIVFLSLTIQNQEKKQIADNFYWLTDKQDVYDWGKTEWYYTPIKTSADFKALSYIPTIDISGTVTTKEHLLEVKLDNRTNHPGFFINAALKDSSGHTLYPVFWNDNYISLLPGETKTIQCTVPETLDIPGALNLIISGWNIKEQILKVAL